MKSTGILTKKNLSKINVIESSLSDDENKHRNLKNNSEKILQIADQFINFLEQLCGEGKVYIFLNIKM